jgi:hypothetical protein
VFIVVYLGVGGGISGKQHGREVLKRVVSFHFSYFSNQYALSINMRGYIHGGFLKWGTPNPKPITLACKQRSHQPDGLGV